MLAFAIILLAFTLTCLLSVYCRETHRIHHSLQYTSIKLHRSTIFLVTKSFGGVHFIFFWSVKESFQRVCLRCIVAVPAIFFLGIYILIWGVFIRVMSKRQGWDFVFLGKERIMIRKEEGKKKG